MNSISQCCKARSPGCKTAGSTATAFGIPTNAKLADLTVLCATPWPPNPGTSLILLDTTSNPNKVLAAIGVGDVDDAERVGVTVGGLNTRVSASVDEMVQEAETQRARGK